MAEIWKQVEGHNHHFVSNMGRVKSIDHVVNDKGRPSHRKGKMLKLSASGNGYIRVVLEGKWYYVHRLVASAFIPHDGNKNTINHINGVKTDNNASNLEWVKPAENSKHAYRIGLSKMTDERRKKIAKSHIGLRPNEETRRKIGMHHKARGYKLSPETRKRISIAITKWHKENGNNKINIQES
jgi:hypothetical protein